MVGTASVRVCSSYVAELYQQGAQLAAMRYRWVVCCLCSRRSKQPRCATGG
jgi:hypothetical protein